MDGLQKLQRRITDCRKCPRLVRWREQVARNPPRRHLGEAYWAKPLAGFGDAKARLLIVGLAPAAHGGNRTGRIFTGDRSGDWLYGALHAAGFANQPDSIHRNDGLKLTDCYISAAVRCAPPDNKPSRVEFERCRPYLVQELEAVQSRPRGHRAGQDRFRLVSCGAPKKRRGSAQTAAAVWAWRISYPAERRDVDRLVSSQPAEYVHWKIDAADVPGGVSARHHVARIDLDCRMVYRRVSFVREPE